MRNVILLSVLALAIGCSSPTAVDPEALLDPGTAEMTAAGTQTADSTKSKGNTTGYDWRNVAAKAVPIGADLMVRVDEGVYRVDLTLDKVPLEGRRPSLALDGDAYPYIRSVLLPGVFEYLGHTVRVSATVDRDVPSATLMFRFPSDEAKDEVMASLSILFVYTYLKQTA